MLILRENQGSQFHESFENLLSKNLVKSRKMHRFTSSFHFLQILLQNKFTNHNTRKINLISRISSEYLDLRIF